MYGFCIFFANIYIFSYKISKFKYFGNVEIDLRSINWNKGK